LSFLVLVQLHYFCDLNHGDKKASDERWLEVI
jgi:hypothetical protein